MTELLGMTSGRAILHSCMRLAPADGPAAGAGGQGEFDVVADDSGSGGFVLQVRQS